MYNKFKVKHKNTAVEEELLLTIKGIYTKNSNLCIHKMFWIGNQHVFMIAYSGDLKVGLKLCALK